MRYNPCLQKAPSPLGETGTYGIGHCNASPAQSKEDKLRANETESGESVNADCGDRERLPIAHCVSHCHCPALIS